MNKAYKTTFAGKDSIVPARSPGQAKFITKMAAEEVGWKVKWVDIKAIRCSEFDEWAKSAKQVCWNPEVLFSDEVQR